MRSRWDRYKREEEELRAQWVKRFRDHVATLTTYTRPDGATVEELRWAKPDSGHEAITYHSVGARLIVTGDLYDAIYIRAEGLRWWASCNWDYFAEKCVASPEGRLFRSWDPKDAADSIKYQLAQLGSEKRREFKERDGWSALNSEFEWTQWLHDNGQGIFGSDYWAISPSKTVNWVCKAHLYGLRLAFEQVDAKAKAVAA